MNGDIQMGFNFSPRFQKPFTDREVVADLTARDTIPSIQRYNLMVVKVESSGTSYILRVGYHSSDPMDNANWRPYTVNTFIELWDTPNDYSGYAKDIVRVNPGGNGLEFYDISTDYFTKDEHVNISQGSVDAGKPVVLTASGVISSTMMAITSGFHFQGQFTPTAGVEYPDATGLPYGAFWDIIGVGPTGYTFVAGDLAGTTIYDGDLLLWAEDGWNRKVTDMNPSAYYKLDGTHPLTAPFKAGGHQINDVADGIQVSDAATLGQVSTMIGNLDKGDIGLPNVDDTSDADKPVSDDTQLALDAKADTGHQHVEADVTDLDKYSTTEVDDLLNAKAALNHNHDGTYADVNHDHVEADITDLDKYTTAEVDGLLADKSDTTHNHDGVYATFGANTFTADQVAPDFVPSSDARLKKVLDRAVPSIDALIPTAFIMKSTGELQYGFIAQQMLKPYPELVKGTGKEFVDSPEAIDYYRIKSNSIIAMLVKEVQELKLEVKQLKSK